MGNSIVFAIPAVLLLGLGALWFLYLIVKKLRGWP